MSDRKDKLTNGQALPMQFRALQIKAEPATEADDRTVKNVSVSSDEPYERWYGTEILRHDAECVDLSRISAKAAPLLYNHDRDALLGKVSNPRLENGRLLCDFKFSSSERAKQALQDLREGILTECSIGYSIEKMEVDEKEETYTATRWGIHEVSLVTIPADYSVGVGRDAEVSTNLMLVNANNLQKTIDEPNHLVQRQAIQTMATESAPVQEPKINVVEERNAAVAAERKRVADIQELSQHFASNGLAGRKIDTAECAAQFIREGKNVDEFQKAVILGNFKEVKPVETNPELGMNKKELGKYSLTRAMFVLGNGGKLDGLEKECSDAAAAMYRTSTSGFFIPHDVLSWGQERALQTNVFSGAGALVGASLLSGSMIEYLRNNMVVVAMGARVMSGLQGNLSIPKQTGAGTGYWLAEGASITGSALTVGQVSLTPHRLAAKTGFSLQLLAQSSVDVENFVREDLMKVLAIKKDAAALNGTGTAGEPLGLTNVPAAQLSTPVTLANAGTITYAEAVRFETNVANANALIGNPGFITTPTVKGGTKVTAKFSNTGTPVWENDMVNGYRAVATLQNTSAKTVLFGDFSQIIIGDWAGMEVLVDPYSRSDYGEIEIKIQHLTDVAIRQPKAFSLSSN